jgi:hypothetical protein
LQTANVTLRRRFFRLGGRRRICKSVISGAACFAYFLFGWDTLLSLRQLYQKALIIPSCQQREPLFAPAVKSCNRRLFLLLAFCALPYLAYSRVSGNTRFCCCPPLHLHTAPIYIPLLLPRVFEKGSVRSL